MFDPALILQSVTIGLMGWVLLSVHRLSVKVAQIETTLDERKNRR